MCVTVVWQEVLTDLKKENKQINRAAVSSTLMEDSSFIAAPHCQQKKANHLCVYTHCCHTQWLQQLALLDKLNRKVRGPARLHVNEADTNRNIKERWIIQRGRKKNWQSVLAILCE